MGTEEEHYLWQGGCLLWGTFLLFDESDYGQIVWINFEALIATILLFELIFFNDNKGGKIFMK